jgi:hypothetical protein
MRMVPKGEKGRHVVIGLQPHAAAVTTVAAVGTALGDMGLTTKRDCSSSAVAAVDVQPALVDELGPSTPGGMAL